MSAYLPFQGTTVSEQRSMAEISDLLEHTGFEKTGMISDHGHKLIVAYYKDVQFRFEVHIDIVAIKILESYSPRTRMKWKADEKQLGKLREQAVRIGWRLMLENIKALCDSIKYGVVTPAEAFSGYCYLPDGRSVASELTAAIETGKIKQPGFSVALLESPK